MREPFISFVGIAPTIGDTAIGQSILQGLKAHVGLPVRVRTTRRDVFAALPEIDEADEVLGKLPSIPVPAAKSPIFPLRLQRLLRDLRATGGARTLAPSVAASLRDVLDGCAALIFQGGPNWNDRMMNGRKALGRWLLLEAAEHYGVPAYHVGVSCGPFAWPYPQRLWMTHVSRQALNRHAILFVRDGFSRPALDRLGVTARVVGSTDAAVFLAAEPDPAFAHVEQQIVAARRPRVVVCVRDYQRAYPDARAARGAALRALARLLSHVQQHQADVFFLSTDHNPTRDKATDVEIARRVQDLMTAPGSTVVDEDVRNPSALKYLYGLFDAMISMRLHPTILALDRGVPCLLLSYDAKCRDFFASVQLQEYAVPLTGFDPESSIGTMTRMLTDRALRQRVQAGVHRLRSAHAPDYEPMYREILSSAGRIRDRRRPTPAGALETNREGAHHG